MVERILTFLFATYANILTSERSTVAHAFRFSADQNAPLPVHLINKIIIRDFGSMLEPR